MNEKNKARLQRVVKQWAASLVGFRHLPDGDVESLAELLGPMLTTVRKEARAAAFREVTAAVMKHGEIIHRGNLIKRLEAAANSAPRDSEGEDNG